VLTPQGLPGLRALAAHAREALAEGQLVIVHAPARGPARTWADRLVEVLAARDPVTGARGALDLGTLAVDSLAPLGELGERMGLGDRVSAEQLIEGDPGCRCVVFRVDFAGADAPAWRSALAALGRACWHAAPAVCIRPLLALLYGAPTHPPIAEDVGVRIVAAWNVISWEEMRLLAAQWLGASNNPLARAWQISTYVGAAEGDVELLERLCHEQPRAIAALEARVLGAAGDRGWSGIRHPRASGVQRWDVPRELVSDWLEGRITALSVDRGVQVSWSALGTGCSAQLRRAIWREQSAGLLPLVMELTADAHDAVCRLHGTRWMDPAGLGRYRDGFGQAPEPGEILDACRASNVRMPRVLFRLLELLRKTRNQLAHLEPVEFARIAEIWGVYDQMYGKVLAR